MATRANATVKPRGLPHVWINDRQRRKSTSNTWVQSDGLAVHIVHPDGRARPDWEFATEPKAFPHEEVSLPEDPAIASLSNHGALTLEELASRICPAHRMSPDRLRSPSHARDLTSVRVNFITQAINLRIAMLNGLARFPHRDPSALTKLLVRYRPPPHADPYVICHVRYLDLIAEDRSDCCRRQEVPSGAARLGRSNRE
jgi:hypothetical protein